MAITGGIMERLKRTIAEARQQPQQQSQQQPQQYSQEQIQQIQQQEIQQASQQQKQVLTQDINQIQSKLNQLQEARAKGGSTLSIPQLKDLDNKIFVESQRLNYATRARQQLATGQYELDSIRQWINQSVEGAASRSDLNRIQRTEQQQTIQKYTNLGYVPIYTGGKLVGFQKEEMYSPNIPQTKSRNPFTSEPYDTPFNNQFRPIYRNGELIGYDTGSMTVGVQKSKISQIPILGSIVGGYQEIKRGLKDIFFDTKSKLHEKVPQIDKFKSEHPQWFTPKPNQTKGGVPAAFQYAALPFVEGGVSAYEKIKSSYIRGMYPGQSEEWYGTVGVSPETKKLLTELGGTYLTFAFFAPAMTTATTAKVKAKVKTKTKSTLTKKEAEKLIEEGIRNKFYIQGDEEAIRTALRKAYESGNKKLIKDAEELVRRALGSANANFIIKDVRAAYPITKVPKDLIQEVTITAELPNIPPQLENLPSIVTGVKGSESIYAGKGQYERTNEFLVKSPQAKTSNFFINENLLKTPSSNLLRSGPSQFLKVSEVLKNRQLSSPILRTPQATKSSQSLWTATSTLLGQKTMQKQILRSRTIQIQVPKTKQIQIMKSRLKTKQIRIPKVKLKIPRFPLILPTKKSVRRIKRKKKKADIFLVETKRFGKWIPIGKPGPLGRVLEAGKVRVKKTLAASLRIREAKTGRLVQIAPLGKEFRPGKKDPFKLVQRRKYRLSSPTEVKEIQLAKKAKESIW